MVTAREKVENPIYQELSGLVLTTKELRDKRMYSRLEKSARDIADVSHKLAHLKNRYKIAEKN